MNESQLKVCGNLLCILWQRKPLEHGDNKTRVTFTLSSIITNFPSTVEKEGVNSWATTAFIVSAALGIAPELETAGVIDFSFSTGRGVGGLVVRVSCIIFCLFFYGTIESNPLGGAEVFPLKLTQTVFLLDISSASSGTMVCNGILNPGSVVS